MKPPVPADLRPLSTKMMKTRVMVISVPVMTRPVKATQMINESDSREPTHPLLIMIAVNKITLTITYNRSVMTPSVWAGDMIKNTTEITISIMRRCTKNIICQIARA